MHNTVSLVVVAYERPQHLRTCLSSIIAQTYQDWNCIVVDNSVSDEMADKNLMLTIMDDRIFYRRTESETVIPGPHIRCLYTATEIGVENTESEYLITPNDDSYYTPWFLERMVKFAKEKDLDLVYCDFIAGGPTQHHPMISSPRECCCDKTSFMVKRKWFEGFKDKKINYHTADGRLLEDIVRRGARHERYPELLVCHN